MRRASGLGPAASLNEGVTMPTRIRIDLRLEQDPDALYREAYRRARVDAPERPITTELYELVTRERDAETVPLADALNGLLADLVANREVILGGEEVELDWAIDISDEI
jgi:hypothetical protein